MQVLNEGRIRLPDFPARQLSKPELEQFHVDQYRADHQTSYGEPPFDEVRPGDDPNKPPDFVVTAAGRQLGVDCAVFADPHRRIAWNLFDRLFEKLQQGAGGRTFDNLRGCMVNIWFGSDLVSLPPKSSDTALIEPILDAMAKCQVDRNATDPAGPPPTPWVHFAGGAGFSIDLWPVANGPGLNLILNSTYTETDARTILDGLVQSHDQPAINHLVITAGGPDRSGQIYSMEESVARFLLEHDANLHGGGSGVPTEHLERISLHLWGARRVVEIPVSRKP